MNHLIWADDTNGISPFHSQRQALTWFYVVVTYFDKALVCEHSNVSCQAALSCFTLCSCWFCTLKFKDFFSNFDPALLGVKGLITGKYNWFFNENLVVAVTIN